jgi:DNA-binding NarL/FixJ family response regulator
MSIRLLVIDEHHVIRAGVKSLVTGTDIKLVADAAGADVGIRLIRKHRPDVVLLDVRMPSGDGLTALGRIRTEFPKVSVLIFSAFDDPGYVVRAIAQGAKGYLLKGTTREKLLGVIRAAAKGESIWARHQLRKVASHGARKTVSDADVALTPRESDVLKQVAGGKSNKEIADALDISQETVKEHVQNILRKIGVVDRTQAAVWAIRNDVA